MLELISWLQELRPKEYIIKDSLNAAIPSPRRKNGMKDIRKADQNRIR